MFIRTARLFLRPAFPEDWREILTGVGERATVRNLATVPWPYGEADAHAFCARAFDPALPSLVVTVPGRAGARVVGACGLGRGGDCEGEDAGEGANKIELGYWIARQHRGRGYATEAVRALIGIAALMRLECLVASHFADNPASHRVLVKAGFRPTGLVRQRYSLGRGDKAPCVEYRLDLTPVIRAPRAGVLAQA